MSNEPSLCTNDVAVAPRPIDVPERARATIESRHIVALRQPRNEDLARQRLLRACAHPRFAEEALYQMPMGGRQIEDFSIRFAEEAARCWRNTLQDAITTHDNDETRTIYVAVSDLESNDTWAQDVVIEKTTLRRHPRNGEEVLRTIEASGGHPTHVVKATERELLIKTQATLSRVYRTLFLRLLPAALKAECFAAIKETMANADAVDPDLAKKRLFDAFAIIGVDPDAVKSIARKPVEQLQPAELQFLRETHAAIKEGQTTWQEVVAAQGSNLQERMRIIDNE